MVRAVVAVTGARGFRTGEERLAESIIREGLESLKVFPTEFVTGAAYGADTVAFWAGLSLWEGAMHHLVVPDAPHNEAVVELGERLEVVTVERMPKGTDYMARNDRMVELAELLVAFPSTREEQQRSGTWATVRRARKRGVPRLFFPLDGTPGWVE